MRGENRHFDTVLMGRNAYEPGLRIGLTNPYPTLEQCVFSTTVEEGPDGDVALVSEDISGKVRISKGGQAGKDIGLAGGATLAASLLCEELIDEPMLKVNPVVLGSGIPLFSGGAARVDLGPEDRRMFAGGVAPHRYRVKGRSP